MYINRRNVVPERITILVLNVNNPMKTQLNSSSSQVARILFNGISLPSDIPTVSKILGKDIDYPRI